MTGNGEHIRPAAVALLARVRDIGRSTEADFLRAGSSLGMAVERFGTLASAAREIGGLCDGVEQVADVAARLDTGLRAAVGEVAAAVAPLPELAAIGRHLDDCLSIMRQRARTMRVISLNSRVVIATMKVSSPGLAEFANEVRDAAGEIESALANVALSLGALRKSAAQVAVDGEQLKVIVSETGSQSLAQLTDELARYKAGVSALTATGGLLAQRSDGLRQAAATAVCALQSGDALRQRLEHTETIIAAALDASDHAQAGALLNLARCQIDDMADRHRNGVGKASAALSAVTAETKGFLLDLDDFGPGHDGLGTALHAAVREIVLLLGECKSLHAQLHRNAHAMTTRIGDLLVIMADFAALGGRMRYIGLNAVIACEEIGSESDPLKAISGLLRELAGDCVQQQTRMQELFAELEAVWLRMDSGLSAASELLRGTVTDAAQQIVDGLGRLDAAMTAGAKKLEMGRRGLDGDVEKGAAALEAQNASVHELALLARRSAPMDVKLGSLGEDGIAVSRRLRAFLTMEEERQVHDEWHRAVTGETMVVPKRSLAPPSLESVLFG